MLVFAAINNCEYAYLLAEYFFPFSSKSKRSDCFGFRVITRIFSRVCSRMQQQKYCSLLSMAPPLSTYVLAVAILGWYAMLHTIMSLCLRLEGYRLGRGTLSFYFTSFAASTMDLRCSITWSHQRPRCLDFFWLLEPLPSMLWECCLYAVSVCIYEVCHRIRSCECRLCCLPLEENLMPFDFSSICEMASDFL